ncbi:MAG TPA: phosphodiester glycosidase family protein [Candidatus Baltobacteraceae bacterium]|nr:phosphodiester glycosidase family protein [Candidatus Baltobacteraceae bacterium]
MSGFIDRVPLQIAGEAHDVHNWNNALRVGSRAMRGLARAYDLIAPTDRLRYVKLETTAPGITYAQYGMLLDDAPRAVQFLTIDPHEPTLHFDTALSGNHLISKGERTSDMGVRTHAVAGLNGDYFDIARTYQPQGMFMMRGRLMRGPTDRQALIVDRDNDVHFSEFHLQGSLQIGARTLKVTQYNNWPLGYVTIVTPDFGQSLPAAPGVRFLSLQYVRGDRYRVTAVNTDAPPAPLDFGVAIGPDVKGLKTPAIGSEVHLQYAIDPPVKHAIAGIGGGPLLLRDGRWYEDPHAPAPDERDVRWPVDALGVLEDRSLIMVAVDGRHPERSVGMTRPEFGKLLQQLGVTDAMALDSGGSVTMVARSPGDTDVSLHNVPSDDSAERYVSNGLFVYSSAPVGPLLQNRVTASASMRN